MVGVGLLLSRFKSVLVYGVRYRYVHLVEAWQKSYYVGGIVLVRWTGVVSLVVFRQFPFRASECYVGSVGLGR